MRASVGPYEVVRELGRGGMGVVYEVRRPGDPRRLAVKLMLAGQDARPEALTRFRREGEVMARLVHENVVRVHALDEVDEGPYLVTDLVEGEGLDAVLRARFLTSEDAARLARALADALAALHAAGALHRDLKPANVIVRPDGTPVLLDFGLTRDLDTQERLTVTGAVMGTPAYMAPEQADGTSPSRLGPAVDVYGLGATLYEALTCRPPFAQAHYVALLNQILSHDPTWPASLRPDVPAALDAIVRRAMAKRPEDRYPTAGALRDDLDAFLRGDRPQALGQAAARRGSRAVVAAVAFLAIGGAGLAAWPRREPPPPATPPPAPSTPAPPASAPPPEPVPARETLSRGPVTRGTQRPGGQTWGWFVDATHAVVVNSEPLVGEPQRVTRWDLSTRRVQRESPWRDAESLTHVYRAAISRDRTRLALCGAPAPSAYLVDVASGEWAEVPLPTAPIEIGTVTGLAFTPDGEQLAVGTHEGKVHVVDLATLRVLRSALVLQDGTNPEQLAYSQDGRVLFAAGANGGLLLAVALDADTLAERGRTLELGDVLCVLARPDGGALVGTVRGMIFPIDDRGGQAEPLFSMDEAALPVLSLAWAPDGALVSAYGAPLARGEPPGVVRLWDTAAGARRDVFQPDPGVDWQWSSVDVSPTEPWLLLTTFGGHLELVPLAQ